MNPKEKKMLSKKMKEDFDQSKLDNAAMFD